MTAPVTLMPTLHHVPVELVAVVGRARKDMGDVPELAQDMLSSENIDGKLVQKGQLQPGIIRKARPDDVERYGIDPKATPWVLVAGGRRYAAVCMAGFDTFMAIDKGDLPPLLQRIYELHENLGRKALHWTEEITLKEEIHTLRLAEAQQSGGKWTQKDTAAEVGETHATVSRDLELARQVRANPELAKSESKQGAIRQIKYEENIKQRTKNVQASAGTVREKLFTADMREFIKTLPDNSIDLTFTDFPFGIEYNFDADDRNKYEDSKGTLHALLRDIIPEMMRVTKETGWLALMMGSTNYGALCDLVSSCCAEHYAYADVLWEKQMDGSWVRRRKSHCNSMTRDSSPCRFVEAEDPEWIWYRPNSRNPSMHPELHAQNQFEKICVVNMGSAVLVQKNKGNVLNFDADYADRIHEMQRPHALCLDIVSRLTVGGEKVADFCFGSGSGLAAAAELQRDFVGCDMNPKCLEPAIMWVSEHLPKR